MSDARIEPARRRDALGLLAIHRAVLEEGEWFVTRADEFVGSLASKEAAIAEAASSDDELLLVARVRGDVVGWVSLLGTGLARHRHVCRLEVMVARTARDKGIGRRLVGEALAWATAHPTIAKVSLVVYAANVRAIALYRSLGFVEEGRREGEYRLEDGTWRDDLLMCRWVKPR
jgi:ribosomal protein S18 acetylase RimI-like enzyme